MKFIKISAREDLNRYIRRLMYYAMTKYSMLEAVACRRKIFPDSSDKEMLPFSLQQFERIDMGKTQV